jgi:hypothetical protein
MQHFVELGHCMAVQKSASNVPHQKLLPFMFAQSFANRTQQHFHSYILHAVDDKAEADIYGKAMESVGIQSDWIIPFTKSAICKDSELIDQAAHSLFDYTKAMMLSDKLAYVDILYFSANVLGQLDERALQQLFTVCTRIKINGGRICFYYKHQAHLWQHDGKMKAAVQLLEPLMASVFYEAISFEKLTHMDVQSCLAYLRYHFIHDIIIKCSDGKLLVADACIEALVDASRFYQSTTPENDEILFGQYMAERVQGSSPGVALANVLNFKLSADSQLAACNPYRSKPRHHYSM